MLTSVNLFVVRYVYVTYSREDVYKMPFNEMNKTISIKVCVWIC